jgi:glycosidase
MFHSGRAIVSFIIVVSLVSLLDCQKGDEPAIFDIIQPVIITAGQADSILISDLFYAEEYAVQFKPHENFQIDYSPSDKLLILSPKGNFNGLALIEFTFAEQNYDIPVRAETKQTHTFRFKPGKKYSKISIFGSFNSWNRENLPMNDKDGDGVYELKLPFDPGRYEYRFFADGNEFIDKNNPDKISNPFGEFNSVLTIKALEEDKHYLHILGKNEMEGLVEFSFYYEQGDGSKKLQKDNIIALLDNQKVDRKHIEINDQSVKLNFQANELQEKHILRVAVNQKGKSTLFQTIPLYNNFAARSSAKHTWQDAIMYSIMIDRFYDGDSSNNRPVKHPELSPKVNYQGGDLQGIVQKLQQGYFDSLYINVLWLSPVNQNTDEAFREWPAPHRFYTAYHGYWPTHHEKVEERFGDLKTLKALVDEAHKRDIKVLLDFIANHTHIDHPFYKVHKSWFGTLDLPDGRKNIRFWDEYRLTTWFEPFMPSFDYLGSDEALEVMTDNAVWWLKKTGVDGFRHDAVKHVPNKFWRRLTQKIKQKIASKERRSIYQIGETFGGYDLISSYVNNGQLDAQFNFNLYFTARAIFLSPEADFNILADELQKTFAVYGMNNLMGNLMDSHDQVRYMALADGDLKLDTPNAGEIGWSNPPQVDDPESFDKVKLYLTYLFTIPGVPTLYYGDEIGMTGASDPDNRRPMRFDGELSAEEKKMLGDVREIVRLRREHSALRHGDFQTLFADKNCFVYLRSDINEKILVALNKSSKQHEVKIVLPKMYKINIADLIDGEEIPVRNHQLELTIPSNGYVVFSLNTSEAISN